MMQDSPSVETVNFSFANSLQEPTKTSFSFADKYEMKNIEYITPYKAEEKFVALLELLKFCKNTEHEKTVIQTINELIPYFKCNKNLNDQQTWENMMLNLLNKRYLAKGIKIQNKINLGNNEFVEADMYMLLNWLMKFELDGFPDDWTNF